MYVEETILSDWCRFRINGTQPSPKAGTICGTAKASVNAGKGEEFATQEAMSKGAAGQVSVFLLPITPTSFLLKKVFFPG